MKVGLQIPSFSWPGGAAEIGPTLARVAHQADDVGFDSIWVMDHFFQIRGEGRPEEPMLEGMTTLGFLAANTTNARLGLMVGGVHYRHPGPVGEGDDDARRPLRRPRLARHRGGLEQG
jgi:alkanesulfonate monooxygenase SsuD/methylene tetrahydromethanopterin reductase-like flavin-dependent oxidoreductase (luciferase family)